MALTRQQLADRAVREARIIAPGVTVDSGHALRLTDGVLHDFSREIADDPLRRPLTRKLFTVTLTNGEADLVALHPNILTDKLMYADVFDLTDAGETGAGRWPLVWKLRWSDLWGFLSPVRGYYALRDQSILMTRRRGTASLVDLATVTVYANYRIDLSETSPCPDECADDLITYLARRLVFSAAADSQPK